MTEGPGAEGAPPTSTDNERAPGQDALFGMTELERRETLAWVGEHLREWLFAGDVTTASFTVGFALLVLVAVPVIGFPFAVIGATAGAQSPSGTLIKPGPSPPEAPYGMSEQSGRDVERFR